MTSTRPATTSEVPSRRADDIGQRFGRLGLPAGRLSQQELEQVACQVAASPELWQGLVVDSPGKRWWLVLCRTAAYEVRVLSWEFDQSSGWHDHRGSSGRYVVTEGILREQSRGDDGLSVTKSRHLAGDHGSFGPGSVEHLMHEEGEPAVSIHAYSPPLSNLTLYDLTSFGFVAGRLGPDDQRQL